MIFNSFLKLGYVTLDCIAHTLFSSEQPLEKTRGFSSVKFVPFRENEIVVLKTEEVDETNTCETLLFRSCAQKAHPLAQIL